MTDYSIQPYSGTDILAMVMATSAVFCFVILFRDKEAGLGWFALGLSSLALWTVTNDRHLPTSPYFVGSWWILLPCLAQSCFVIGILRYLQVPRARVGYAALPLVFPVVFAALNIWVMFFDGVVLRQWLVGWVGLGFAAIGVTMIWASPPREIRWNAFVAMVFFSVTVVGAVLGILGYPPLEIRYWMTIPIAIIGVALPSVVLLRRQHELQEEVARRAFAEKELAGLNQSLEERIEIRTRDLQGIVAGLESFNRSVSHDLHGPLSGISSLANQADAALRRGDSDKALFALPLIAEEAANLRTLVSSLLNLARVADARMNKQIVDVTEMAQDIVDQLRVSSTRALPRIVVHALPPLYTDPGLLRAVLANLIGNAIKFTPENANGCIDIDGTARGDEFCLTVRDQGIGFDTAKAGALFEPFFRLKVGGNDGHGIGLSIVSRAVERLGGKVWAESQPGQGATFSVSLPVPA